MASVRSAEVRGLLAQSFPHNPSSAVDISKLIKLAFPGCESKHDTKGQKETFYIGVRREMASLVPTTSATSLDVPLSFERAQNEMLTAKVDELERRVHSLQQSLTDQECLGSMSTSAYKDEIQSLVSSSSMLSDGPNTIERLETFSLSDLISNVRQVAPTFYSLLCDLGDVRRNARDADNLTQNEIKAFVSLCILANARSRQTKGVQLFLSIMLIARAVNKQVSYATTRNRHKCAACTCTCTEHVGAYMHYMHVL